MKLRIGLLLFASLFFASAVCVIAQEPPSAAETAQKLRTQLSENRNHDAELKMRLEELNFDLKPENIERHFAGYGSTRPEELREARRRKLQTEKDRVQALLNELESDRLRLETAISAADARAYQQSALGAAALPPDPNRRSNFFTATRISMGVVALGLIATGAVFFVARRRRRRAAR
jgi:hypothetical protein